MANNVCAFPDKMVKKHKDFIVCASGNTYGTGADRKYVGRLEIDAATLDRFAFAAWERAPREWREKVGFHQGLFAGYGRPIDGIKKVIKDMVPTDNEPHIVFDAGVADHYEKIDEQVEQLITKR